MNDYSEIQHGLTCLRAGYQSLGGQQLQTFLQELYPGIKGKLELSFQPIEHYLRSETYVLSLSEHEKEEDDLGRLSMWRAYGGTAGVALVLNSTAFASETDHIKAYSAPVTYAREGEFQAWFERWCRRLIAHRGTLSHVSEAELLEQILAAFRVFVLCTKHPGFKEEREWRLFHTPQLDGGSPWLSRKTDVIGGVPQVFYELALVDQPEQGVTGVHPATLINRVIIGPCEHPLPIRDALIDALRQQEVPDAEDKVRVSFIPLRHR